MPNQHRRGRTRKLATLAAPAVDETIDRLLTAGDEHCLDAYTPFDTIAEHIARCTPTVLDALDRADPFLAGQVRSNLELLDTVQQVP